MIRLSLILTSLLLVLRAGASVNLSKIRSFAALYIYLLAIQT